MEFSAVVAKEGKWYVASSPELDIASQGKTKDEALKNLKDAIELYLEDEDAKVPRRIEELILTFVRVEGHEVAGRIRH